MKDYVKIVAFFCILWPKISCLHPSSNPSYRQSDEELIPPYIVLFVSSGLLVGGLCRFIIQKFRWPVPFFIFVMLMGMLWGVASLYCRTCMDYSTIIYIAPNTLLVVFVPLLVFKVSYCVDTHMFLKSFGQIFIISVPILLVNALTIGAVMLLVLSPKWSFSIGLLFGILCCPILPRETVDLLKNVGPHTKHLIILLQGETLLGVGSVAIMFEIVFAIIENWITVYYQVFMVLLRFIVMSLILGTIVGFIGKFLLKKFCKDTLNVLVITLVFPYAGYYICEQILGTSGIIAVLIIGLFMSSGRSSLVSETDLYVLFFWKVIANILITILFVMIGTMFSIFVIRDMELRDLAEILMTYLISNVARFLSFMLFSPILFRIGYGFTIRNLTVAVWGGMRNPISFCFVLIIFNHRNPFLHELGRLFLMHFFALYFLTFLINASTMHIWLNVIGINTISMAKLANMNSCMKFIMNKRNLSMTLLKMNKVLADANWKIVNDVTNIKHPYKVQFSINETEGEEQEQEDFFMGYRITYCSECKRGIFSDPTPRELKEMRQEARLKVLKAKKVSYSRQYENGMLTQEGKRILNQAIEIAMDSSEGFVELEGLFKLFKTEGVIGYLGWKVFQLFKPVNDAIKPPRKQYRKICHRIVTSNSYEIFLNIIVLLNVIPIVWELSVLSTINPINGIAFKSINLMFYCIYLTDFGFRIFAYSFIYICSHGFKMYFSNLWNTFDFACLLICTLDIIFDVMDLAIPDFSKAITRLAKFTMYFKLIRLGHLLRLMHMFKKCNPKILKYFESCIDQHMSFAYDVGKGFVQGEEDILELLPQMIDNETIREELKKKLETDRLSVVKQLGMVQKDRPWIAITVKTKQAICTILNSVKDSINDLKANGWIDEINEYNKLMVSWQEKVNYLTTIKTIQPSGSKDIFEEVPWMDKNDSITDYLFDNAYIKSFDVNEPVCVEGEVSEGIFILFSGLLKLVYLPNLSVLTSNAKLGLLPIVDYIPNKRFTNSITDFIVTGNSVGELSTLTNRPYNCTITAESYSQAYVISRDIIKQATDYSNDPIDGLQARIWKTISNKLAMSILAEVPAYHSQTQDELKSILAPSIVLPLVNCKMFTLNDLIEDVILIEGTAIDYISNEVFKGPCYIPRSIQKMTLPKSSKVDVSEEIVVKVLVIPIDEVNEIKFVENLADCFYEDDPKSVTSLQNSVHNYMQKLILKRKKRERNSLTRRRLIIDDSFHSPMDLHFLESKTNTFPAETPYKVESEVEAKKDYSLESENLD